MSLLLGLFGLSVAKLIAIVAAGVIAGLAIFKIATLVFSWLVNKIKQKLAKRNISKVATCEIQEMVKNCNNQATIDEMMALQNQGITHFTAEVQDDGTIPADGLEILNVEKEDQQTHDFINRTGEGMVVISA